jgi:hypothetical protein
MKSIIQIKLVIPIICFFISCKTNKVDIVRMNRSGNKDSIFIATELIHKSNDSSLFKELLFGIYDSRVSNNLHYKGMSIYQAKIQVLQDVTGKKAPHKITYEIDSTNVMFYKGILKVY